jgi:hypothetical protein
VPLLHWHSDPSGVQYLFLAFQGISRVSDEKMTRKREQEKEDTITNVMYDPKTKSEIVKEGTCSEIVAFCDLSFAIEIKVLCYSTLLTLQNQLHELSNFGHGFQ